MRDGVMRGWSDAYLDQLRRTGDVPADTLLATYPVTVAQQLLLELVTTGDIASGAVPDSVKQFIGAPVQMGSDELHAAEQGEAFFALYGPEIMLVLCCASLPFDYANARAVEVLHETGFLAKRPNLRVAQTGQLLVDMLSPGGLAPGGHGVRSSQRIRLMHAAVRRLILEKSGRHWNVAERGIPINQEDLLYTWISFTEVVLEALGRVSVAIDSEQEQSYLNAWHLVGRAIGIIPECIPRTMAETRELKAILLRRNQRASAAGKQMTEALSGLVGEVLGPLGVFRWSLLYYLIGDERARLLGVPRQPLREGLVRLIVSTLGLLSGELASIQPLQSVMRALSLRLIRHYIEREVGGAQRSFRVPPPLFQNWRKAKWKRVAN